PAQREDRLEVLVARVDGRAAGGVALDEEQLALLRIGRLAVGQLARKPAAGERTLPLDVAGLAGSLAGARGVRGLLRDPLALGGVLLEPLRELRVHGLLDEAAHPRVAELALGLALELRVADLDRDHRGEALAGVLALERLLLLLEHAVVAGDLVHRA